MEKQAVVLTFQEDVQSYKTFSVIKKLHLEQQLKVEQIAIIKRKIDGELSIEDFVDITGADKTNKGGLVGMFVGILGGPFGVLLGGLIGSTIGIFQDKKEITHAHSVFENTLKSIKPGKTGVIAIVEEQTEDTLNSMVQAGNGKIDRYPEAQLRSEIEAERKKLKNK
ncbi:MULTISPECIES: DUF1269 domain-containing protein [Bacillus cereus group]|jgi:uncharacterized membrane protein|uniref:DUF1269 domain-containing protein n=2 Tax=Bacillus cereus group TaxID=86661 RepID=A0AA44Q7X4_BACCE|nr:MULTISPECIES: DUF1269 domain-containing protein [Bacillus cereus group]EEL52394.1 hypothetical protein bcere0022_2330 [Bacillus cereus Rock3-44]PFA17355.1 DUF1269 domain-containing protein [Bacillus cereus]PFN03593.1 DUF1269 domain-containing protein [Bacillus cereus]PFO82304.1 DUF1269 domain-containing protein [Bacillus cereus]PFR18788.1 DUF1269 domain-containing protein [Bacillus cereus]